MSKGIIKLSLKALLFLIPALLLIGAYLYLDPFKVLWTYPSYYVSGEPGWVGMNREYVSTETFKAQYPTNHYDSFIFGNSRTRCYQVSDWEKHIQSTRCFHFDASGEGLYGIDLKFRYLDRLGVNVSNALIIFDYSTLNTISNRNGHLFRTPPTLSGESPLAYQYLFFRTFTDSSFFIPYLHFKLTGHFYDYMHDNNVLDDDPVYYELYSNEIKIVGEGLIATNPAAYYGPRMGMFYARSTTEIISPPVIGPVQKQMLSEIQNILIKDHSNYRIIINPLYDQKKLNPGDLNYLSETFGRENVYDFSGVNQFTQSYTNYYETSHYRPHVAREIMNTIYSKTNSL